MNPAQALLVVIDMQNGFLNRNSRHILPTVIDLVSRWRAAGGLTVFTRYRNFPGSPYERLIGWTGVQTSPDIDIVAELADAADTAHAVLDKTGYTMFNPDGAALVAAGGWQDLIFCGVATESCVLKSAVDAFEADYTPWIVVDACASHAGTTAHEAGLLVARRFIGARQLIHAASISPSPARR